MDEHLILDIRGGAVRSVLISYDNQRRPYGIDE
jgi:hypothetical protein